MIKIKINKFFILQLLCCVFTSIELKLFSILFCSKISSLNESLVFIDKTELEGWIVPSESSLLLLFSISFISLWTCLLDKIGNPLQRMKKVLGLLKDVIKNIFKNLSDENVEKDSYLITNRNQIERRESILLKITQENLVSKILG